MQINLKGRTALVTGGSGAIGRQICLYLNRAGAKVIGACMPSDVPAAEELLARGRAVGVEIDLAAFDVSSFDATSDAIAAIEARHGNIDILINCAGITRDAPLRKMTAEQWQQVMSVNLNSVFNTARQVVGGMTQRGWGRIVNISSVNGQKGQFGQVNYSAAKAGDLGFTKALAQEGARANITVNAICPGYIATEMVMAVPEKVREAIIGQIPVGRLGEPEEIARAVVFLAADDAGFITGSTLSANGGQFFA